MNLNMPMIIAGIVIAAVLFFGFARGGGAQGFSMPSFGGGGEGRGDYDDNSSLLQQRMQHDQTALQWRRYYESKRGPADKCMGANCFYHR